MAKINFHKVKLELPAILNKNAIYFVEILNGFDLYVTSSDENPVAKKLNSSEYVELPIEFLLANNGSNLVTLTTIQTGITELITIQYRADRNGRLEVGLIELTSKNDDTDTYRESNFNDCGLYFLKIVDVDQIKLLITDLLADGNSTKVKMEATKKIF